MIKLKRRQNVTKQTDGVHMTLKKEYVKILIGIIIQIIQIKVEVEHKNKYFYMM